MKISRKTISAILSAMVLFRLSAVTPVSADNDTAQTATDISKQIATAQQNETRNLGIKLGIGAALLAGVPLLILAINIGRAVAGAYNISYAPPELWQNSDAQTVPEYPALDADMVADIIAETKENVRQLLGEIARMSAPINVRIYSTVDTFTGDRYDLGGPQPPRVLRIPNIESVGNRHDVIVNFMPAKTFQDLHEGGFARNNFATDILTNAHQKFGLTVDGNQCIKDQILELHGRMETILNSQNATFGQYGSRTPPLLYKIFNKLQLFRKLNEKYNELIRQGKNPSTNGFLIIEVTNSNYNYNSGEGISPFESTTGPSTFYVETMEYNYPPA